MIECLPFIFFFPISFSLVSLHFLSDSLSLFSSFQQGDEDKVVPPNQSITMHAALKEKGLPCALKLYEGEQHGFRQAANIQDALQSELYFFSQVFKFKAAGDIPAFPIDNLD